METTFWQEKELNGPMFSVLTIVFDLVFCPCYRGILYAALMVLDETH